MVRTSIRCERVWADQAPKTISKLCSLRTTRNSISISHLLCTKNCQIWTKITKPQPHPLISCLPHKMALSLNSLRQETRIKKEDIISNRWPVNRLSTNCTYSLWWNSSTIVSILRGQLKSTNKSWSSKKTILSTMYSKRWLVQAKSSFSCATCKLSLVAILTYISPTQIWSLQRWDSSLSMLRIELSRCVTQIS